MKAPVFDGLSVIVASISDPSTLQRCLDALIPQIPGGEGEILVIRSRSALQADKAIENTSEVQWVEAPAAADVFELRRLGIERARGSWVALIEDHVEVELGWRMALDRARRAGFHVVGGPVDWGGRGGLYGWALYLSEYGIYMGPRPWGPAQALSGVNVAYGRQHLESCRHSWCRGFHEIEVHEQLRAKGIDLHLEPGAGVRTSLQMPGVIALKHLFSGGRHFGGYRVGRAKGWKRIFWAIASPVGFPVLAARLWIRTSKRQPEQVFRLFLSWPLVLVMLLAWSAGEIIGSFEAVRERG